MIQEIDICVVEASDGNRREHYIKEGEITGIQNILFTLNKNKMEL